MNDDLINETGRDSLIEIVECEMEILLTYKLRYQNDYRRKNSIHAKNVYVNDATILFIQLIDESVLIVYTKELESYFITGGIFNPINRSWTPKLNTKTEKNYE